MAPMPPWWPKMELKNFFLQKLQFSIAILRYLEVEIDYRPFILYCRVVVEDYAQEVSSQYDQNLRRDGDFCDLPYYDNISV